METNASGLELLSEVEAGYRLKGNSRIRDPPEPSGGIGRAIFKATILGRLFRGLQGVRVFL